MMINISLTHTHINALILVLNAISQPNSQFIDKLQSRSDHYNFSCPTKRQSAMKTSWDCPQKNAGHTPTTSTPTTRTAAQSSSASSTQANLYPSRPASISTLTQIPLQTHLFDGPITINAARIYHQALAGHNYLKRPDHFLVQQETD